MCPSVYFVPLRSVPSVFVLRLSLYFPSMAFFHSGRTPSSVQIRTCNYGSVFFSIPCALCISASQAADPCMSILLQKQTLPPLSGATCLHETAVHEAHWLGALVFQAQPQRRQTAAPAIIGCSPARRRCGTGQRFHCHRNSHFCVPLGLYSSRNIFRNASSRLPKK